jgi:NAD(P)H dehydrogenase (quinone)
MIVITGATGQLGRLIVEKLAGRIPVHQIGVSVRDRKKATDLEALGVRVRSGDFSDSASLKYAFEGATQVLIVSSNARASGGDPVAQHRSAIDAARSAGVRRIVYTSHMAVSASSAFPPMHDHHATEEMLRQSGLEWTALRNGFYGASGLAMMGDARTSGSLLAPEDGKVSWTAHADLAEAAAIILASEGKYDGPTPPLVGSEALDFTDIARIASELQALPVQRQVLRDDEMLARMAARGLPEGAQRFALGFFVASRNGEFATADRTLEQMLCRAPLGMRDLLARQIGKE